jgi:hypothetical protein
MKAIRQIGNGLQFEAEADSQLGLFKALADIDKTYQEVFGEKQCGCCQSNNIFFNERNVEKEDAKTKKVKKYQYFEMKCRDCWATLSFGQHQEGDTLFPKRKLENGEFDKEHRGWKRWKKTEQPAKSSAKKNEDDDAPF